MRGTTAVPAASCGGGGWATTCATRDLWVAGPRFAVADLHGSALMQHMRTCLSDWDVPVPERLR